MNRDELVHAMMSAGGCIGDPSAQREDFKTVSAVLDVAIEELLKPATKGYSDEVSAINYELADRRSRYLQPRSAEEKLSDDLLKILKDWADPAKVGLCEESPAEVRDRILRKIAELK